MGKTLQADIEKYQKNKAVMNKKDLTTDLYSFEGEKVGTFTLPEMIFGAKVNPELMAQAVKVYLANQRKSHASAKERSEVSGTTKKMWAQKGTGRARHGSDKAPQFVGGGKAHGPSSDRDYSLTLNKKMRTAALKAILTKIAQNKTIIVVDDLSKIEPKTKIAWDFMDKLEKKEDLLAKSRKIGIITSAPSGNIKRAFGNIPGFSVMNLSSLNVYNLSNQNFLVFTKKAWKPNSGRLLKMSPMRLSRAPYRKLAKNQRRRISAKLPRSFLL